MPPGVPNSSILLGHSPCPGGTSENSPTLQRWVHAPKHDKSRRDGRYFRNLGRPFGTCPPNVSPPNAGALGYIQSSLRDDGPQILVALNRTPGMPSKAGGTPPPLVLTGQPR